MFPAQLAVNQQKQLQDKQNHKPFALNIEPHTNGKLRILFADDKQVNRKVISLILTSMGHEVTLASNGQQALQAFKPGKFDLILMDIQMPVMDGITATQKLKQKYKNPPPIVALSASAFEGDREKYMALGMDDYLTKPLNIVEFEKLTGRL
jgi:CheY-like chemotaxis protein